jgi:hypothetical protein
MTRNCDDGTTVSVNPFIADAARVVFAFTACRLPQKFIRRWSRFAMVPGLEHYRSLISLTACGQVIQGIIALSR